MSNLTRPMMPSDISSKFCHYLYGLAKDWPGENRIYSEEEDGRRVLVIQDYNDADRVMRHNIENYTKNFRWFSQVAGNSRLTEEGEQWKFRQGLSQPFLGKYDASRAFSISVRHAEHISGHLTRPEFFDILGQDMIHQGMLSIFTQMFLEVELEKIPLAHTSASRLIELASAYAFLPPGDGSLKDRKESIQEILQLRKTIFEAMQCFRGEKLPHSPMLERMLQAESVKGFDFAFEKELTMLFGAGTDTASYSLGWALHLLAVHQDIQARLYEGLVRIFDACGDDPTRLQSAISEYSDLQYFIAELLRLYPPLPFVTRLARGVDSLSDLAVNPGDVLVLSLLGVNHRAWGRADPWVPDLDAAAREGTGMGTGVISSFVWGQRVCGGRSFALVELAAVLAVLIYRLRFEVTRSEPIVYEWVGQMRRQGGHRVRCLLRAGQNASWGADLTPLAGAVQH